MAEYPRLCEQYEGKGAILSRNEDGRPVFRILNRLVLEDLAEGDKEVSCSTCEVRCNWERWGMLIIDVLNAEACIADLPEPRV